MPPSKPKVIVVLPAYNAEKTLERTVADIPAGAVDQILLVDDCSQDRTVQVAQQLGLTVYRHSKNRGYGGNQKTCYARALEHGADIVVMCHPDYQHDPRLIPSLIAPIIEDRADAVFGSRIMERGAVEDGMPRWKHRPNIVLTALVNRVLGTRLTECHCGFRAYSSRVLKKIDLEANSDNFVFDTQIISQIVAHRFRIAEIPIRARYFPDASSIGFGACVIYTFGIFRAMADYALHARGLCKHRRFAVKSHAS